MYKDIFLEARLPELYTKEPDQLSEFITKKVRERERKKLFVCFQICTIPKISCRVGGNGSNGK